MILVTLVEPENERSARGIREGSDDRGSPQPKWSPTGRARGSGILSEGPQPKAVARVEESRPTHIKNEDAPAVFQEPATKTSSEMEESLPPALVEDHSAGGEIDAGERTYKIAYNFNIEDTELKVFLDEVRSRIDQAKRYPWLARLRGMEGRIQVRFRILPSGEPIDIQILQSSQSRLLDEEAITTVKRAARFPQPPVTSRLGVVVRLPLIFHLEGRSHRNE